MPGLGNAAATALSAASCTSFREVQFHLMELGLIKNALAQQEGAETCDGIALRLPTCAPLRDGKASHRPTASANTDESRARGRTPAPCRTAHTRSRSSSRHNSPAHRCRPLRRNGSSGTRCTTLLMLPPGVLTSTGTEMAYSLSSTTNSMGSLRFDAEFSDSQNSPWLVVPSPHET